MMKLFPTVGVKPEFESYECNVKTHYGYISIGLCRTTGAAYIEQYNCDNVEDSVILANVENLIDLRDALIEAVKVARYEEPYNEKII